jgi:hypothetical protein
VEGSLEEADTVHTAPRCQKRLTQSTQHRDARRILGLSMTHPQPGVSHYLLVPEDVA